MPAESGTANDGAAAYPEREIRLPRVAFCRVGAVLAQESHQRQLGVRADTRLYTEDQVRAAIEADRKLRHP